MHRVSQQVIDTLYTPATLVSTLAMTWAQSLGIVGVRTSKIRLRSGFSPHLRFSTLQPDYIYTTAAAIADIKPKFPFAVCCHSMQFLSRFLIVWKCGGSCKKYSPFGLRGKRKGWIIYGTYGTASQCC